MLGKSGLWEAIADLTARVLVPMAEVGVVHADLRFGWDSSYTLMVSDKDQLVLQPIDLESLVPIGVRFPVVNGTFRLENDRCDEKTSEQPNQAALLLVWWQI